MGARSWTPMVMSTSPVVATGWMWSLTRSFSIDRSLNRWDLTKGEALWFEDRAQPVRRTSIKTYPRIGVDYAGTWANKPWRFRLDSDGVIPRRMARAGAG